MLQQADKNCHDSVAHHSMGEIFIYINEPVKLLNKILLSIPLNNKKL